MQEAQVQSLGWEDSLEGAWQPSPVFLPKNPIDRGAWWPTVHGVKKSQTQLKQLNTNTDTHTHTHTPLQPHKSSKANVMCVFLQSTKRRLQSQADVFQIRSVS